MSEAVTVSNLIASYWFTGFWGMAGNGTTDTQTDGQTDTRACLFLTFSKAEGL